MAILVLNSGSSSLKFRLYAAAPDGALRPGPGGAITRFGADAEWHWQENGRRERGRARLRDQREATGWLLRRLTQAPSGAIDAIGHRVVHGGETFTAPVLLTPEIVARLEALSPLAPLHNPPALAVIRACREALGEDLPMVAVFDTAFHATLPEAARLYALPADWVRAGGLRRYGFHGLAHRSMYERWLALCPQRPARPRVITFQLGHGCSACAIDDGVSCETSMGYTPLEGLIMATRAGDVDPGVFARLAAQGVDAAALEDGLNHRSGLRALGGSDDMRELLAREAGGDPDARRAVEAFCHRARKYLGAYLAVLGGADAVLFGGGIGEHAPAIRARICEGARWCGLHLEPRANAAAVGTEARISAPDSAIAAYVITVDEEILVARDARALLALPRT